jgi:hypothetical protein
MIRPSVAKSPRMNADELGPAFGRNPKDKLKRLLSWIE